MMKNFKKVVPTLAIAATLFGSLIFGVTANAATPTSHVVVTPDCMSCGPGGGPSW
jgi:hypothetical protein